MELILNLFWVLLAVPAYWIWRRPTESVRPGTRLCSWHYILVLGCILTLLFPVISATDDLHAMRPESEESCSSKRSVKHCLQSKASSRHVTPPTPPVIIAALQPVAPGARLVEIVTVRQVKSPYSPSWNSCATRAPPSLLLA